MTITFTDRFGGAEPGTKFELAVPSATSRHWGSHLEVSRAKTIAIDQDGKPAVVVSSLGAGKTMLVAYPIEAWLAATPSAFDQSGHELAGADRRYVVLVNHAPTASHVTLSSTSPITRAERITPDGPVSLDAKHPIVDLAPWEGTILSLR